MSSTNRERNTRIIWWDLETTGLNPFYDKIIEISAKDNYGNSFSKLLKIDIPLDINIVKITKITDELLKNEGDNYDIVIKEFYNFLVNKCNEPYTRIFMIAHNGDSFDKLFLKTQLHHYGLILPNNIYWIDSLHLSRLVLPHMKSHSLQTLCKYYKIENTNAHRAESDVLVLMNMWNIWTNEFIKKFGSGKVRDIYNKIYF